MHPTNEQSEPLAQFVAVQSRLILWMLECLEAMRQGRAGCNLWMVEPSEV